VGPGSLWGSVCGEMVSPLVGCLGGGGEIDYIDPFTLCLSMSMSMSIVLVSVVVCDFVFVFVLICIALSSLSRCMVYLSVLSYLSLYLVVSLCLSPTPAVVRLYPLYVSCGVLSVEDAI
jgi:hypothetical protein